MTDRLVQRVKELEARVEQLEYELEDIKSGIRYLTWLSPQQNRFLEILMMFSPRVVPFYAVDERIENRNGAPIRDMHRRSLVSQTREKLAKRGVRIHTVRYNGYVIDAENRERLMELYGEAK